jgi:signal transduction histidine kinase
VILCTAHFDEREARDLADTVGVCEVIAKPSEPDDVIRKVEDTLGLRPPLAQEVPRASFDLEHLRVLAGKLSQKAEALHLTSCRLQALVALNLRLMEQRDCHRLLEDACHGARELLGARYGALGVREGGSGASTCLVASGMPAAEARRFGAPELDRGVLGEVFRSGRAMRMSRPFSQTRDSGLPEGFPGFASFLAAPVSSPGATYGWICLMDRLDEARFSEDDEQLLTVLGSLVGRCCENERFFREAQLHAAEQLQFLSRRLVDVQESERRDLARELHDRVGQNLTVLGINLDILGQEFPLGARPELRSRLEDSATLVESTADAIDNVMSELRPPMLDDHGLLLALQWYSEEFSRRTGIGVEVRGAEPLKRVGQEVEITLFRIVQEPLNNVAKHGKASHVSVELDQGNAECVLTVSDDGIGFDPALEPSPRRGHGLVTMRERAEAVGGRFDIGSIPDAGTEIMVRVPS